MKINCATENFRSMILDEIDASETAHSIVLDSSAYDDLADEFAGDVLHSLTRSGVEWSRCYTQSRGAMVAVQSATENEIDAFDLAADAARPEIAKKIYEFVRLTAAAASEA